MSGYSVCSRSVTLQTMNGGVVCADRAVCLKSLRVDDVELGPVSAFVVSRLPLDVDLIIGLDVISEQGITVDRYGVKFGTNLSGNTVVVDECRITDRDFDAWFSSGFWTVRWNWRNSDDDGSCTAGMPRNFVKNEDIDAVTDEMESWLKSGILVEYNPEVHGKIRRFLPVIAVRQQKGDNLKIRPSLTIVA